MLFDTLMLAAAVAAAATPPVPQEVAATPVAQPPGCELHVWPAERFSSMTTGLLGGGLLDAAIHADTDKNNRTQIASALDSQGHVDALNSLDLAALLKVHPARVIVHNEPLVRHTVNDIKTRRSDSQASCYSELIVADLFYQKAAIYGRTLRALFIYRDFGANGQTATRIYKNWGGNGLKLFPPKPGEDVSAANAELTTVFKADFQEFARNEAAAQTASR